MDDRTPFDPPSAPVGDPPDERLITRLEARIAAHRIVAAFVIFWSLEGTYWAFQGSMSDWALGLFQGDDGLTPLEILDLGPQALLGSYLCLIVLGALLWARSSWLARTWGENSEPLDFRSLNEIVWASLGLYVLVFALGDLVEIGIVLRRIWAINAPVSPPPLAVTLQFAVEIGLGLFLLLGSRGLAGAVLRLRLLGKKSLEGTRIG